jgi:CubicO group peptidase (beta-lactamase class C family)
MKSKGAKIVVWALGILAGVFAMHIIVAMFFYQPAYVFRVLAWGESDAFDWQKFPEHLLEAAPEPFYFREAHDDRAAGLYEAIAGVDDWDAFLESNHTQAFIVIQDGAILYEKYFNNTKRDSIVTSFSMAKSFTSALIGIAIDEGYIKNVNDSIIDYLPELARRDSRFKDITIRHLLMMSSGLEYKEMRLGLFNGDDPLTTYYPDQRKIALENTNIVDPPGAYFQYNKYHPQLLGMILERTTGGSVTDYLQTKIWNPCGMEFSGSWSIDSEKSDFEKMETGVNARAIDFAKFGQLFLNGGNWNGKQVISSAWVVESTKPYIPTDYSAYYNKWFFSLPGHAYYNYMWWGMSRDEERYDFMAEGDKGQYIYICPYKKLVIVRNGTQYGIESEDWVRLFYQFASDF